jgi:hypothetical protein
VAAAMIGGLTAGLVIGAAEWFALRRWVSWLWIPATSIGMAAGLTAGAALVGYGTSRGDILIMGAVTGLGVGALQALVLSRSRVPARCGGDSRIRQPGHLAGSSLVRDHEKDSGQFTLRR